MTQSTWRATCKNHISQETLNNMKNYDANAQDLFPLLIPEPLSNRIDFSDENDPILMQVMPQKAEFITDSNYSDDPVGDINASPATGVIHKYHGRVLLITNGACAVNCRYCFRRNFHYPSNHASGNNWSKAIAYIKENTDLSEVILSGGDPLMLSTKVLLKLSEQLIQIQHIKTLRIHTRMPIVTPERITTNLLNWLTDLPLKKVMVVHSNHPNELDDSLKNTFESLKKTNTLLLNQSVLLKDINNQAKTLAQLSHRLFEFGVLPYYLNQLDKASGTTHFRIPNSEAIAIHRELLELLPGYLVPKLVEEISGKKNKSPIF